MRLTKEQLASLTLRDPLSFGISYLDLLEGKEWEVATRAWAKDIYAAVNPWSIEKYPIGNARRLVVTKSTQAGISTLAITKALHFAVNWDVRIFYTLPRQQDVLDFVSTRIEPMIMASPLLKQKVGKPDSAHAKRLGNSYLFFMELNVEPRMMPADALFVDEVDLSNPDNMSTALNRLDASRWKLATYLSTPTVPNYGIHGLYETSDKRQWLVKCPKCNYEQPLDWELNLRIEGARNKPSKVFYGCVKCNAEITVPHIQTGRWVAEYPDLSREVAGFHVHQMLTTPAEELYAHFRDPQQKLVEFYRKRLGKPYEIGSGSVTREDFLVTCFDTPYDEEYVHDNESTYYLGADQGNEIQVVIAKKEKDSKRKKVVHVELIPLQAGFDRLAQLMNLYKIRRAVVDGSPNRHSAINLIDKFPGRLLVADYIEQKEVWKVKKAYDKDFFSAVNINRTSGFDSIMESIKEGEWALPGNPPTLAPDMELLIDHVTALKRDIETRRTQAGDVQVGVYRRLRADHLAHAMLYLNTAMEIDDGRKSRVAVIKSQNEKSEENVVDVNKPKDDIIVEITARLAEVPKEQISSYLGGTYEENKKLPFPLSYKLKVVKDAGYSDEDIEWVMEKLLTS